MAAAHHRVHSHHNARACLRVSCCREKRHDLVVLLLRAMCCNQSPLHSPANVMRAHKTHTHAHTSIDSCSSIGVTTNDCTTNALVSVSSTPHRVIGDHAHARARLPCPIASMLACLVFSASCDSDRTSLGNVAENSSVCRTLGSMPSILLSAGCTCMCRWVIAHTHTHTHTTPPLPTHSKSHVQQTVCFVKHLPRRCT
jgi:hypothetical protein